MNDIITATTNVAAIMGEIMTASGEQSRGIEQVNQAIVQLDNTTQQNAALVEQVAASAQKRGIVSACGERAGASCARQSLSFFDFFP